MGPSLLHGRPQVHPCRPTQGGWAGGGRTRGGWTWGGWTRGGRAWGGWRTPPLALGRLRGHRGQWGGHCGGPEAAAHQPAGQSPGGHRAARARGWGWGWRGGAGAGDLGWRHGGPGRRWALGCGGKKGVVRHPHGLWQIHQAQCYLRTFVCAIPSAGSTISTASCSSLRLLFLSLPLLSWHPPLLPPCPRYCHISCCIFFTDWLPSEMILSVFSDTPYLPHWNAN